MRQLTRRPARVPAPGSRIAPRVGRIAVRDELNKIHHLDQAAYLAQVHHSRLPALRTVNSRVPAKSREAAEWRHAFLYSGATPRGPHDPRAASASTFRFVPSGRTERDYDSISSTFSVATYSTSGPRLGPAGSILM